MQIVIDINEDYYKMIKYDVDRGTDYLPCVLIANGTPLPKHHGRLIDADALNISHGVFLPRLKGNVVGCPMDAVFADEINDAPTIIEAED